MARHLISLADLDEAALAGLVRRAVTYGNQDHKASASLAGSRIGILFTKSSTRTRTAFWSAAATLGANIISYGPEDLQLKTGETMKDTSTVLSSYLDALVVRTNEDVNDLHELALQERMGIVNALTRDEHPTQAIADLTTLSEHFGSLKGVHVLWVGEGNSTAAALALGVGLSHGMRLTLLSPPGYALPDSFLRGAQGLGEPGRIKCIESEEELDTRVHAVYTSRWQTMGVPKASPNWRTSFRRYQVDVALMDRLGRPDCVFMHDLPAVRGDEVTGEVLDGPHSIAWRQAFHKMTSAMSVLEWCADRSDSWQVGR